MKGKTHMMLGVASGITVALNFSADNAGILVGSAIIGSIIPDIDHPRSTFNQKVLLIKNKIYKAIIYSIIGIIFLHFFIETNEKSLGILGTALILTGVSNHRGFTHSLLGIFLYSTVIKMLATKYNINDAYLGFVIGYMSHLIADYFTRGGIRIFYPFGKAISSPLKIKAGGKFEELLFISAALYSLYRFYQIIKI
ncbi:metal-dependent hydrolase [Thermohalobacter berrensis]|uniref:Metal-dependent hydrolase n=1 Tax=Thermohalobacter berrensis TaxID=99594 RepID=A0A419SXQ8_9FIRM|nr:metal-dependent hydrolase [Thermohalobacter berrensis]RKD30050.1 hypothetical protein BET03_04925 [Thermohalobacter berrensis]